MIIGSGCWGSVEEILEIRYRVPVNCLIKFGIGVENWLQMQPSAISLSRVWGQEIRRRKTDDLTRTKQLAAKILAEMEIRDSK